jgi:hypothetical protein
MIVPCCHCPDHPTMTWRDFMISSPIGMLWPLLLGLLLLAVALSHINRKRNIHRNGQRLK